MSSDFQTVKDAVLSFLAVGCVGWFTYEIRNLRRVVEQLSINSALALDKLNSHEKDLDRLKSDKRVRRV